MATSLQTQQVISTIAKYGILFFGIILFGFSWIMGAGDNGGGLTGLLQNFPNTLPWLAFLLFGAIAWKNELLGGTLILVWGIGLVWFFNFSGPNFWVLTFVLTLIFPILGACFLISWYLKKKQAQK